MRFLRRMIVSKRRRTLLAVIPITVIFGGLIAFIIFVDGKNPQTYFNRHGENIAFIWIVWVVSVYVSLTVLNAVIKNWDNDLVRKTTFGAIVWLIGAFIFLFTNEDTFRYWRIEEWGTLFVPPIFVPSALYIYHSYIK